MSDNIFIYWDDQLCIPTLKNTKLCNLYKTIKNNEPYPSGPTIIAYAADWGIRTRNNQTVLEDATRGGRSYPIDIQQLIKNTKRCFATNLSEPIHNKIYPVPIGLDENNRAEVNFAEKKTKLCYANFTITSPYRIRVAEWAWKQDYIDCFFPKRYLEQDKELQMPILTDKKLPTGEFLETLSQYRFSIAPTGNGFDTFRTWECVLSNTVPIVQDVYMNRIFSKIWPMILVHRYELTNVLKKMNDFYDHYGEIQYDTSLLQTENMGELLDRLQYERLHD